MRFLSICLLILGIGGFSKASEDQTTDVYEAEYSSVEDYVDSLQATEELEEGSLEDFPELSQEDFQDAYSQDLELDEAAPAEASEVDEAFKQVLQDAFRTWNAAVKGCDGDVTCIAQVNNVLRPVVNEAADKGVLPVIEPCEDRVGTYEVETDDGWTIEAVLPC